MVLALTMAVAMQATTPEAATLRAEINAANIMWVDAVRRQDPELLKQMMAPDYVVTFDDGKIADLPTWTGRFMKIKMNDYGSTITNLRIVGADVAEASVSAYWDSTLANGKSFRETFTARDTWMRRSGRWVAVKRDVVDVRILK